MRNEPSILVLEGPLSQKLMIVLAQAGSLARTVAEVAQLVCDSTEVDLLVIDMQTLEITPELYRQLKAETNMPLLLIAPKVSESIAITVFPLPCKQGCLQQQNQVLLDQLPTPVIQVGNLRIDLQSWRVTVAGKPIAVSRIEFRLLAYLAQQIGKVVDYDDLFEQVWGYCPRTSDRKVITNCVRRLRQKLGGNGSCPEYLVPVPGVGYRLRNQRQWQEEYDSVST